MKLFLGLCTEREMPPFSRCSKNKSFRKISNYYNNNSNRKEVIEFLVRNHKISHYKYFHDISSTCIYNYRNMSRKTLTTLDYDI